MNLRCFDEVNSRLGNTGHITIEDRHFAKKLRSIKKFSKDKRIIITMVDKEYLHYIKGRSVITNLLLFTDDISKTLSKFYQLDTVYLSYTEGFRHCFS